MDWHRYAGDFLAALEQLVTDGAAEDGQGNGVIFHGGRVLDDHDVVLLYRERAAGPVLGRRFDVEELAGMFSPLDGPHDLADVIYGNEVLGPTGRGDVMDVDWAEGLGFAPRDVQWVGAGPWLGEDRR